MASTEELRHIWGDTTVRDHLGRDQWRCLRCGRRRLHRVVNGSQGICHPGTQVLMNPFGSDARMIEVMRPVLAEFA